MPSDPHSSQESLLRVGENSLVTGRKRQTVRPRGRDQEPVRRVSLWLAR
jgi:hypothetical protein